MFAVERHKDVAVHTVRGAEIAQPSPEREFVFETRKPTTHRIPKLEVALHGRSFKEAATTENLALGYPDPVPGWLNIGVLHTALEGNTVHAHYAPCSMAELEAKGYQYWALGHVHEHRIWRGKSTVVFPGNLQGRHIRETGPRGAVLVTADGVEIKTVERLHVDVLRWHLLEVDVSSASTLDEAVRLTGLSLENLSAGSDSKIPLAVRVSLQGSSPAHGELFGLESQLRGEILAQAIAIGAERIWIEKIKLETKAQETAEVIAARSDAIADLQSLLNDAELDEDFMRRLQDELFQLIGKAPVELLKSNPELTTIRSGRLQDLVRDTVPSLVARLAKIG